LIFDGNPLDDITLLGEQSRFSHIFKDGKRVDCAAPLATSWKLPGWRVSEFSERVLTKELVQSLRETK